jgi:drug/metabolite transporter (DMT)-like permease
MAIDMANGGRVRISGEIEKGESVISCQVLGRFVFPYCSFKCKSFAVTFAALKGTRYKIRASDRGIAFMLLAVVFFSGMNASVKMLHHLPAHELIFWRSIISFSISFAILKRLGIALPGNNKKWLIMRGLAGTAALLLFFLSLRLMPLATASTVQYLSPIFTVLFAGWINQQKVPHKQWWAFSVAFLGVLCIKGFDQTVSMKALGIGIASAAIAGLAYNAIIKCKDTDHPVVIMIYFPLMSLPFMAAACLWQWVTPQGSDWWYILVMGLTAQVAQYCTTRALQSDDAARVAPWNYVGAILAVINGYIFFGEPFGWMSALGMAIVVLALIWSARIKSQAAAQSSP